MSEKIKNLYIAVNEMMGVLGAKGEISTTAKEVDEVMNALYEIDGGVYNKNIHFDKWIDVKYFLPDDSAGKVPVRFELHSGTELNGYYYDGDFEWSYLNDHLWFKPKQDVIYWKRRTEQ